MVRLFDLKNALSSLVRDINYALLIILSLSLSLGISLFIYTQIHSIKYSQLEFSDSDRIMSITRSEDWGHFTTGGIFYYDFQYFEQRQTSFEVLARYEDRIATLSTNQFTEMVNGAAVNAELFAIADTQPLIGRVLNQDDNVHGSAPVAVLGYELWSRLFDKRESVLGKSISLNGTKYTVVGVMPKGFKFPVNHDIWVSYPMWHIPEVNTKGWMTLIGKLKEGVSEEAAQDEMMALSRELSRSHPQHFSGKSVAVIPYVKNFAIPMTAVVNIMLLVSIAIMLMGGFSVANLVVVRMLEHSKTSVIKAALGIRLSSIVVTPLIESLLLCLISGVLGAAICFAGVKLVAAYLFVGPYWWEIVFQKDTVLAAIVFVVIMWVATGIVPVVLAMRKPVTSLLAGGRKGGMSSKSAPVMNVLTILQIVPVFVLMCLTAFSAYSLHSALSTEYGIGFNSRLVGDIRLSEFSHPKLSQRFEYYENLQQKLVQNSEINEVAFTSTLPGFAPAKISYESLESSLFTDQGYPDIYQISSTDNLFEVLDVSLIDGRWFIPSDGENSTKVVIIDKNTANKLWPDSGNIIGKQFQINPESNSELVTVVGLVENVLYSHPLMGDGDGTSTLYRPIRQHLAAWDTMHMIASYQGGLNTTIGIVKQTARVIDSQVAVDKVMSFHERLGENSKHLMTIIYNFVPASLLAMVMAVLAIYGITARVVLQSTNDIGVMKAVGASDLVVYKMFFKKSSLLTLVGIFFGALIVLWSLPMITENTAPLEIGVVTVLCVLVGAVVAFLVAFATSIPLIRINQLSPQLAINYSGVG